MTNLHNLVVIFGGWSTENSAALTDLEIWNGQTWVKGPDQAFQTGRHKFGMVSLSFPPGTCEIENDYNSKIGNSYKEWAENTKDNIIG